MRVKIYSTNHFRLFILLFLLLGATGPECVWGQDKNKVDQTTYTEIKYKDGKRQELVPEKVDTLFVTASEKRELFVPDMRINDGYSDTKYKWYVRWYFMDESGEVQTENVLQNHLVSKDVEITEDTKVGEGGEAAVGIHKAALKSIGSSLFWYDGFYNFIKDENDAFESTAVGASTVEYTCQGSDIGRKVVCDVSLYTDNTKSGTTFTEPTLSKRYVFVIADAKDCAKRFDNGPEEYTITAPSYQETADINLQMRLRPDSYRWYGEGDNILAGSYFRYEINDKREDNNKTAPGKQVIQLKGIKGNEDNKVKVYAVANDGKEKHVATFTIDLMEDAGYMLEDDVKNALDPKRHPEDHPELYEEIGYVDFDYEGILNQTLSCSNNMWEYSDGEGDKWKGLFNYLNTSYAFVNAKRESITNLLTPIQNQFGLYCSANVESISRRYVTYEKKDHFWYFAKSSNINNNDDPTVYDRTHIKAGENSTQYGYFYYVDASNEPGTIVRVPITGNICEGTELLVTAWVNDMTRDHSWDVNIPLPPNINLNFIAENETTEENIVLHRFTSGNALTNIIGDIVPGDHKGTLNHNIAKWQQLAYTLTIDPDLVANFRSKADKPDDVKFYLEVQNNAAHTDGADYAIDDVRIYRTITKADARQANSLCEDAKTLTVYMDYQKLLRVLGLQENDQVPSSLQPDDDLLKKLEEIDTYEEEDKPYYRKLQYFLFGVDDEWKEYVEEYYDVETDTLVENHGELIEEKDDTYVLNMDLVREIQSLKQRTDKTLPENITDALGFCFRYAPLYYDMGSSVTTESGLGVISTKKGLMEHDHTTENVLAALIDESIYLQNVRLPQNVPSRTYYLIYIPTERALEPGNNIAGFNDDCGIFAPIKLQKAEDLVTVKTDGDTQIQYEEMQNGKEYTLTGNFYVRESENADPERKENATFDWFFGSMEDFEEPDPAFSQFDGKFSVKELLLEYHNGNDDQKEKILAAFKDKWGENRVLTEVDPNKTYDPDDIKLVIGVQEIKIKAKKDNFPLVVVPTLAELDDLPSGNDGYILYCSEPRQFEMGGKTTLTPGDPELPSYPDNYSLGIRIGMGQIEEMVGDKDGKDSGKSLQIPLFSFDSPNENDPQYRNPAAAGADQDIATNITLQSSTDPDWKRKEDDSPVVAELVALNVEKRSDGDESLSWDKDYFRLVFKEEALSFKEGYTYTLAVPYSEKYMNKVLTGSFKITLKIVPEYVTYQGDGDGNRNWNNDVLWYRATKEDLYDSDDSRSNKYKGKDNAGTFTPMDFTNVIIRNKEAGKPYSAYPYLYELKQQADNNPVLDMKADGTIGEATEHIEYDLVVDETYMKKYGSEEEGNKVPDGVGFACVRFYGNTCKDIYFKPQTEMPHTEFLTYEKAWIDYELDANRWYTLASPLKDVVAGDMYLPSAGGIADKPNITYAVQKAPAFSDIEYDKTNGTRWDPPVYMRGWDKAADAGAVVVPGDDKTGIQYGQAAAWSNLYNKVDEPFTPTTGFSIGVEAKDGTDKVLFRLPKADESYFYFPNEADGNSGDETTITRNNAGKLITYDVNNKGIISYSGTASGTGLQLVGNPFMAHLDMTKFLGNDGGTYYILTENGTKTSVIGDGFTVSTAADDATKVAPLQSFLVEKDNIAFTADMQTVAAADGTPGLRSALISEPKPKRLPEIRITAERDGWKNTAVVAYLSYASDGYEEEEDASLLISKEEKAPQVYTAADKQMLAINLTNRLHDIPVGVYSADESPVTLTFSVSDPLSGVTLYDKQEKRSYAVTEGMTLTVPGNTSGRYVLNGSVPTANEIIAQGRIIFYNSAPGRIDVSSVDALSEVTVYDISGRALRTLRNLNTPTASVDHLAPGIYVVRAESGSQVVSEKVEVK